jgi:hypothetical protein
MSGGGALLGGGRGGESDPTGKLWFSDPDKKIMNLAKRAWT